MKRQRKQARNVGHVAVVAVEADPAGDALDQNVHRLLEEVEVARVPDTGVVDDRRLVHLDPLRPFGGQRLQLLVESGGELEHERPVALVVPGHGEGGDGVGAREDGLHGPASTGAREAVVVDQDRLRPAHRPDRQRLPVVGVALEPAQEPGGLEAGQATRDVGERVLPADLAVGDQLDARLLLLGDHLGRDLAGDLFQRRPVDLAPVEAGDRLPQPLPARRVTHFRVVGNHRRDHAPKSTEAAH